MTDTLNISAISIKFADNVSAISIKFADPPILAYLRLTTLNIIYQATVIPEQEGMKKENYIGLTSTTFKARWANHNPHVN